MARASRVPERSPAAAEARAERTARSLEEPLDVRTKQMEPYPLLEVRNPIHRTSYLVMLPEFPSPRPALCTCTDFARRGLGTCKHIEAGARWLAGHAEAAPPSSGRRPGTTPPVWAEIDRRERELPPPARLTARELSRRGAPLFE